MYQPVGIRSIAINFPSVVRTNDYFREHHPELVDRAKEKSLARAFSPEPLSKADDIWTEEMMPYLSDPFLGVVKRRVLGAGESSLTLECKAAKDALEAAQLSPDDVDLMLVTSMFPEYIAPGNAAPLAHELGLRGAAWNVESTCSSALVALQTACALVRAGEYRNVLVVVSSTYSRFVDENDTLSFLLGDGAGAFLVERLQTNQGVLSTKVVNTAKTFGGFFNELAIDSQGNPRMFIRSGKNPNKILRELFVPVFRACCEGAMASAGVSLDRIDFFVFNTLIPWYSRVYTRALGIDSKRTIDLNPEYGNIGVASIVANLYHAAQTGKIRQNDLVLVYTFGGTSNAAATLMRWGDVALGSTL